MFRFGSQATPYGELSWADVARPASPANPKLPEPATVLITAVNEALGLSMVGIVTLALRTSCANVSAI